MSFKEANHLNNMDGAIIYSTAKARTRKITIKNNTLLFITLMIDEHAVDHVADY